MVTRRAEVEAPFKDYYYVLGLQPHDDASAIDEAYWRLAREYADALRFDPSVAARLDEANEAYRILSSTGLRREYDALRDAVLGEGAPPQPPPELKRPAPPLAVMEKQRPRPRARAKPAAEQRRTWRPLAALGRFLSRLVLYVLLSVLVGLAALAVLLALEGRM